MAARLRSLWARDRAPLGLRLGLHLVDAGAEDRWPPARVSMPRATRAASSVAQTTTHVPVPSPSFIHRPRTKPRRTRISGRTYFTPRTTPSGTSVLTHTPCTVGFGEDRDDVSVRTSFRICAALSCSFGTNSPSSCSSRTRCPWTPALPESHGGPVPVETTCSDWQARLSQSAILRSASSARALVFGPLGSSGPWATVSHMGCKGM
jgi:hypothetical protein